MKKAIILASLILGFWMFSGEKAQAAYTPAPGDLIRTKTNPTVLLIADDLTRVPLSATAYAVRYGNDFSKIVFVEDSVVGIYANHSALNTQNSQPNGTLIMYTTDKPTIYLIENGLKRPFATLDSFTKMGYTFNQVEWVGTYTTYATGRMIN